MHEAAASGVLGPLCSIEQRQETIQVAVKNMDNGVKGPTYFDGLTEHIENPTNLCSFEWRRKLKTKSGNTLFKIKFYGKLYQGYIRHYSTPPQIVIAVNSVTGEEILLFDGCRHGYNAMFCDTYTTEELKNRPVNQYYRTEDGQEIFEVELSVYYQINFLEEFSDEMDEDGKIELIYGEKMSMAELQRNGFDVLQIILIDQHGKRHEVISEELA